MCQPTGQVITVDHLGSICIPQAIRELLPKDHDDEFIFYIDEKTQTLKLKPFYRECMFCKSKEHLLDFSGTLFLCETCFTEMDFLDQ